MSQKVLAFSYVIGGQRKEEFMKKLKKSLLAVVLCVVCLLSFSIVSFAATGNEGVMPCYQNLSSADLDIGYFDDYGLVTGTATKQTGTTKLLGVINVYVQTNGDWVEVASFSNETTRGSLAVSGEFPAQQGNTYKAVFTVTGVSSTLVETDVLECVKTYN